MKSVSWRVASLVLVAIAYGFWINIVGKQYLPMLLLLMSVLAFVILMLLGQRLLRNKSLAFYVGIGFLAGYASSVVAALVVTFVLYGVSNFAERAYPATLFDYPLVSLVWAFGAISMLAMKVRDNKR
ncbi:hypothetical protein [Lysobacter sp. Root604]|uniref:hypothetical protein n=1 Tax=Lysobacter sp. Root604 TaxID=1736568 RepID=UPI0012FBC300|nr:hypothetical protein [Lysobacter sp. Root604]